MATSTDAAQAGTRSRGKRISERRRSVLAGVGIGLAAALSGCLGDGGGSAAGNGDAGSTEAATASEGGSTDATAAGSSAGPTESSGSSADLDLREANVVVVEIEQSESSYTFDVTLHHDDDGEEGYANWWQVETLSGEKLGRRELLHAHGSEPFTRSDTIDVPENVSQVVVRGHDEVHGYGGQAMIVTLQSGETDVVKQGPESRPLGNESGS